MDRLGVVCCSVSAVFAVSVIPWRPDRPPRVADPPLAVPCRAESLRASLFLQGAHGTRVGGATITNASKTRCSLLGRPVVHLVGGSASSTEVHVVSGPPLERDPSAIYDRDSSLRALAPGRSAYVWIRWTNWCPPGTGQTSTGPAPSALLLELPEERGALRLPLDDAPRCDGPQEPSILVVAPFGPRGRFLPRSSHLPLRASIDARVSGSLAKPLPTLRARRGEVLHYTVTLTNTSSRPFRFEHCPTYLQGLAPGGLRETFVLNCRPVGALKPRGSVRFAMRLRIPTKSSVGSHGLTWELAPTTHGPPFTTVRVIVSP